MSQKGLAPILIIVLIATLIGVYLLYQNQNKPSSQQITQPSPPKEIAKYNNGSTQICGDIPDKAFPEYVRLEMRTGPKWSPDCKHIAWAMWQSGTGCPDCPKATLSDREGVFLYSAVDKTVTSIYKPKNVNETPEFLGWIDNDNLVFKASQQEWEYNLTTNKVSSQSQTIDTSNWKTYTNNGSIKYKISYPANWSAQQQEIGAEGVTLIPVREDEERVVLLCPRGMGAERNRLLPGFIIPNEGNYTLKFKKEIEINGAKGIQYIWGNDENDKLYTSLQKNPNSTVCELNRFIRAVNNDLQQTIDLQSNYNQILSTFEFTDQNAETANWKTYTNNLGFSVNYPTTLEVKSDQNYLTINDPQTFQVNGCVARNKLRIEMYVQKNTEGSWKQIINKRISDPTYHLSDSKNIKIGGIDALRSKYMLNECTDSEVVQLLFKGSLIEISKYPFNSEENSIFEQFLSSFQFTQ